MPMIPKLREQRPNRPPTPAWVKFALLLVVVFGLLVSGWLRRKERDDVRLVAEEVTDYTSAYADVYFTVQNGSSLAYEDLPVMIRLYADGPDGTQEIASKLIAIDVEPGASVRLGRRLEQLARPIAPDEAPMATVQIHQHDSWF